MESPAQSLSKRIIARLVQENLLTTGRGEEMQDKLAEGKLKPEDWKVEIELSGQTIEALSHE